MAEAGEVVRAVWRREAWSGAAEKWLGALIQGRRSAVLSDLLDGRAQLYRTEAKEYSGFVLFRFEDGDHGRGLVCYVLAAAGRGMAAALVDFRRLCAAAGVSVIRFECESGVHARFYESMGAVEAWRVYEIGVNDGHKRQ